MDIFLELVLIILGAKIGGLLAEKLKQPAVIGEILTGMLLGPHVLGLIKPTIFIQGISQIGIVLLMFLVGLRVDLNEIKKLLERSSLIAFLGVVLPLIIGIFLGTSLGWGNKESLILGSILTATSVTITARTLTDMKKIKTKTGITILDAAVVDDILGVLVLILVLSSLGVQKLSIFNFFIILIEIALFFIIPIKLSKKFIPKLIELGKYMSFRVKEGLFSLILVLVLFFSYLANFIGLSAIIGAFLVGLIIPYEKIKSIKHEFYAISYGFAVPVFFTYIGLMLNPYLIISYFPIILLVLIITSLTKFFGCFLGSILSKFNFYESLLIGVGMIPRLEVATIILELGRTSGLISEYHFSIIISGILLTILITPLLLKLIIKKFGKKIK